MTKTNRAEANRIARLMDRARLAGNVAEYLRLQAQMAAVLSR